jgi:hypothetical protein
VTAPGCPHCGGATGLRFAAVDRNRRLSDERFRYWECERCGLLFLAPVPDDIGRFYPPDYYALPPSRDALVAASRPHDAYKVDLVDRLAPPGRRLAEVGPGIGGFAALAADAGYDVSVIEMDERACAFLAGEVGVTTHHTADAGGALRRHGPFDVVALWHVIEHLPDPFATLGAVAGALAPPLPHPDPDAARGRSPGGPRRRARHDDRPRDARLEPLRLARDARAFGGEPLPRPRAAPARHRARRHRRAHRAPRSARDDVHGRVPPPARLRARRAAFYPQRP